MSERIVEVEWEDSRMVFGWGDETFPPVLNRSYGVIVHDDEAFVAVAPCINDTENPFGQLISIPRSSVRKVTELSRKRR